MMKIALGDRPRILITRADRIGDLVISTAVFPEIRKKFPKAHIAALTNLENRQILEGNPYLNEVILYDKKGREKGIWGNLRLAREIAAKKFDIVIHLHATNRMHQLAWLARIPVRVGWDRRAAWALTWSFPDIKKEGKKHEGEYNFDFMELIGVRQPAKMQTFFSVPEAAEKSLEMLLQHHKISQDKPWIVLSPGASCPSKRWPTARFGYAAEMLTKKFPAAVFFAVGGSEDKALIETLRQNSAVSIFDLSGRLSLSMLGALFKRASVLISNDSGPVHIASAVGTPVVSIFGRNQAGLSPRRWRPLSDQASYLWKDVGCNPCLAHECQIQFLCLDVISVEEVVEATEKLLIETRIPAGSGV